ncbi:MAG: hypothetical protein OXF19_00720 [Hyphomicrobiales bacterium]|nr:hypothetical protein [Hyphomicrobiales bacterium]
MIDINRGAPLTEGRLVDILNDRLGLKAEMGLIRQNSYDDGLNSAICFEVVKIQQILFT